MAAEELVVAVGDYDHTRDVVDGRVRAAGLELRCVRVASPEELFARFLDQGEFDVAELSLAVLTTLAARGDDRFAAIPVFPARSFRHGAIYVRADGPTAPGQLTGATIGIPAWLQTAGVYVRGMLASRHGLRLADIRWIQAGVDRPGRREPVAFDCGAYGVTAAPAATLDTLLLYGQVDAVVSARPPASVERGDPRVRRLFADPVAEEIAYFRATGIFPIMHVLVLRRAALERHPGAAAALYEAFAEAKRRSLARAAEWTVPSYPLAWTASHLREARAVLGDDPWPYGLEPNRVTLDAFLGYAFEQGLTPRRLVVEELFAWTEER